MNREELKTKIKEIKDLNKGQFHMSKYPELKEIIFNETSFLIQNATNGERVYCILNEIYEIPKCYCGNNLEFNNKTYKYKTYCCRKCQDKSALKKAKSRETCMKRYGCENPMQNKDIIKKSVANNNYAQMVKTHRKNFMEKYGVDHPMKLQSSKDKIKETCMKRYGCENPMHHEEFAKKCLDSQVHESKFETEVFNFIINELHLFAERHNFSILGDHEVDIYIKEKNLAIECNGEYWHREENGKDKMYHINKTEKCENKGIYLIQIFESEWNTYKEDIKSFIINVINNKELNNDFKGTLDRRYFNINRVKEFYKDSIININKPKEIYYNGRELNCNKEGYLIWDCGSIEIG